MAVRLTFSVFGEDQIDRTLARFEVVEDMRPAWYVLQQRFLAMERRQFDSEGAFGSGGWAPLSPAYARWKAAHYPGQPILQREGDLVASLTEGPAVAVLEPQLLVLGSDVEYGHYHQAGAGHLPRRRPVEFTEAERREWVKVIQRYIVTGTP